MTTSLRVVAFGELLLRLSPAGPDRLVQAESFGARYTGAEANVAVALATCGCATSVVSKVPDDAIGQACINYLRRYGVGTDEVRRGGERLGILFVESGAAPRPTSVLYDRRGSAFATSSPDDYDWHAILSGASWLHFSGTAPAVGEGVEAALIAGLALAQQLGIGVSCDINYRAKIWSLDRAAQSLGRLLPHVDVLTGSGEDGARIFGLPLDAGDVDGYGMTLEGHARIARILSEQFGLQAVAATRRGYRDGQSLLTGSLFVAGNNYVSRAYELVGVVERIGAGDAYSAGVIYGLLHEWSPDVTVEFATAMCCLKHTVPGDFSLATPSEIEALATSGPTTRVDR